MTAHGSGQRRVGRGRAAVGRLPVGDLRHGRQLASPPARRPGTARARSLRAGSTSRRPGRTAARCRSAGGRRWTCRWCPTCPTDWPAATRAPGAELVVDQREVRRRSSAPRRRPGSPGTCRPARPVVGGRVPPVDPVHLEHHAVGRGHHRRATGGEDVGGRVLVVGMRVRGVGGLHRKDVPRRERGATEGRRWPGRPRGRRRWRTTDGDCSRDQGRRGPRGRGEPDAADDRDPEHHQDGDGGPGPRRDSDGAAVGRSRGRPPGARYQDFAANTGEAINVRKRGLTPPGRRQAAGWGPTPGRPYRQGHDDHHRTDSGLPRPGAAHACCASSAWTPSTCCSASPWASSRSS